MNDQNLIAILANLSRQAEAGAPADKYAELDDYSVIHAISAVIRRHGVQTVFLEADQTLPYKLASMEKKPDFAFNIAEGLHGDAREAQVPALLEILQIPYSASGVETQAITLNKAATKKIVSYHGIPTAGFWEIASLDDPALEDVIFPVVVKPKKEGSSMGVSSKSHVRTHEELREMIGYINHNYGPAIIEQFLPGREFTVGLYGDQERIYRMPIIEILLNNYAGQDSMATYAAKYTIEKDMHSHVPRLDRNFREQLYQIAETSFRALECRDYARIDIRCIDDENPMFLEINCLPGLHPRIDHVSYFTKACRLGKLSYPNMINGALWFAAQRQGVTGLFDMNQLTEAYEKIQAIDERLRR
ncbi:MAG: ATP-grasp domain-containing protein [Candidatus Woesearchaeota archaeon]|nr:ATP-grasp domain-containing protein [Candidatus Woesearchaeota archaeon]